MKNTRQHSEATGGSALVVERLSVDYHRDASVTHAVRDVSLTLQAGETLGIVGKSGSGKSSVANAIMRLLPRSARVSGSVRFGGDDLFHLPEQRMRHIRGRHIGMVFQDPAAALNPVYSVGTQIVDTLRHHHPGTTSKAAWRAAGAMANELGLPAARLSSYPHQLSGGMRQRALIVAAMLAQPSLIIADEPTSDLDTINQKQIVRLLSQLQRDRNLGVLLISHDLGVIAALCERVVVMYLGRVVEAGPTAQVLSAPRHPYTESLVRVSLRQRDETGLLYAARRPEMDGMAPNGCPYYDRCDYRLDICIAAVPDLLDVAPAHSARCVLYGEPS